MIVTGKTKPCVIELEKTANES